MKKSLLLLSSLFVLSNVSPVLAQDEEHIAELESQIEETKAKLESLENELSELISDEDTDTTTGINEPQEVNGITVTLLNVEYTDERNQFEEVEPDNVLKITYEIINNSGDDIPYSSSDFVVYVDGKQMDTYAIDSDIGSVADGRTVEGVGGYAIIGEGQIEIEWEPFFNMTDEKAHWEIEI